MGDRFKVDLRGIIDLAANHLYSSPDVFVREVIQNAVDAITARRQLEPSFSGLVRLELTSDDSQPGTLCITDNGVGLTLAEVHSFLSTVGGSSKRADAVAVAEQLAEDSGGFLGRFGIGLLSCFMVTDEIVVVTRSAREVDATAVEWRGRADGTYSVRELSESKAPHGTSVYLKAKTDVEEYFERERLIELAKRYGEMLSTPIEVTIGADQVRINQACAPWNLTPDNEVALADFCQSVLGFRPIDVFAISAPAGGLCGYAFLRPDRGNSWSDVNRLYASGMFVSDSVHGLVPTWATFVGCVLDSTGLRLTASRESVQRDEALENSNAQIGAAIRARLAYLLRNDSARFEAIMAVHDTEIRGLAVKDAEFFDLIIDLLEFETSLGPIRLGEFRREHERILVARTPDQFRNMSKIAAAAGLRIFNGGFTYHEELLVRAVQKYPELELRSFDSSDLVDELCTPEDPEAFNQFETIWDATSDPRRCELVIRDFEPSAVPAFYALGLEAEFHRQLDRTKTMSSGLWQEVLEVMAPRPDNLSPTRLCLNAKCPMIRRLATISDATLRQTGLEVIYVQALMSGNHPLTGDELAMLNRGMERLLTGVAMTEGNS